MELKKRPFARGKYRKIFAEKEKDELVFHMDMITAKIIDMAFTAKVEGDNFDESDRANLALSVYKDMVITYQMRALEVLEQVALDVKSGKKTPEILAKLHGTTDEAGRKKTMHIDRKIREDLK